MFSCNCSPLYVFLVKGENCLVTTPNSLVAMLRLSKGLDKCRLKLDARTG